MRTGCCLSTIIKVEIDVDYLNNCSIVDVSIVCQIVHHTINPLQLNHLMNYHLMSLNLSVAIMNFNMVSFGWVN